MTQRPDKPETAKYLTTAAHQFVLTRDGLLFWQLPLDPDDEDYVDPNSEVEYVLPRETVTLAELILANREALMAHQERLDKTLTPLADIILDAIDLNVDELAASFTPWAEVRRHADNALNHLIRTHENEQINAWYQAAHADDINNYNQREEILLRYVQAAYIIRHPSYAEPEEDETTVDE